ncbi:MAG: aldehyde dehydrogenase (NADP(+)) [Acidobacteria bacterium]|nr:aldehyde dehydrogenase (NADP(+)) [Acidobacteriota bacterium]
MNLHGENFIGARRASSSKRTFNAYAPAAGRALDPVFFEASAEEVDAACGLAGEAFFEYRRMDAFSRAGFLERIADEIEALGDLLIKRASMETALPEARLLGERGRTTGQLRMFAALLGEGSWVGARIDRAIPDRQPVPKPDLRRLLIALGPVAVFGASNFPFAYSVAGGDTASALAAGCPVVVKAHPAHPGASELVAEAIRRAVESTGMPEGVFSMVHGVGHEVGRALVRHSAIRAVGFTGSLRGGRALFDAAATRPDPIPVYAEMGSSNPVFLLPGALAERGDQIAAGLHASVTLGVGQFCTCPGLVIGIADESLGGFQAKLTEMIAGTPPGVMLSPGLLGNYQSGVERRESISNVAKAATAATPDTARTEAGAVVFATDAETFFRHEELNEEIFGPATMVVACASGEEMERVAESLEGHLTATVHGNDEDLRNYSRLIERLAEKAGRLIFNGYPTGVEVCPSMQHGGPYPATTDSRTSSVGSAAIERFARPVCYQNFPDHALPVELRDANTCGIWRLVDGELTKDDV